MSKPDDWYPHYVADYAGDTMHLTTVQHGAYRLLMDAYWKKQGPLDDNDGTLASTTKMTPKDWKKARPIIAEFFHVGGGKWRHKRIERELAKARTNSEQHSRAGKASAEAKRQRKLNGESTDVATAEVTEQATAPPTDPQREGNGSSTPHTSPSYAAPSGAASDAAPDDAKRLAEQALAVLRELQAICGTNENRHFSWARTDAVTGWLQAGADPELDIYPAAKAVMVRRNATGEGPPKSAKYLADAVLDALRARKVGATQSPAEPAKPTDPAREAAAAKCNAAMDAWIAGGRDGPMPRIEDFLLEIPEFLKRKAVA